MDFIGQKSATHVRKDQYSKYKNYSHNTGGQRLLVQLKYKGTLNLTQFFKMQIKQDDFFAHQVKI